jgi:hypothetical protein
MPNLRQLNLMACALMIGMGASFLVGVLCGALLR